jgi:hypothetical protein
LVGQRFFALTGQQIGRRCLWTSRCRAIGQVVKLWLVQTAVAKLLQKTDTLADFRLTPADSGLKRVMQAFERGDFGSGSEGLNTLAFVLAELNYKVDFLASNAAIVEHSVDRYATRIARTIRKHSK